MKFNRLLPTLLLVLIVVVLAPAASNAKDASYYLNHPDPKVRQEYMDKVKELHQQKRIEEYERYRTNDPSAVARLKSISAEWKKLEEQRRQEKWDVYNSLSEWGKIKHDLKEWYDDKSAGQLISVSILFILGGWFLNWTRKLSKQQKADVAAQAKSDKIARRTLEKEKILAGESLKTK